jgi:hypothetical protein
VELFCLRKFLFKEFDSIVSYLMETSHVLQNLCGVPWSWSLLIPQTFVSDFQASIFPGQHSMPHYSLLLRTHNDVAHSWATHCSNRLPYIENGSKLLHATAFSPASRCKINQCISNFRLCSDGATCVLKRSILRASYTVQNHTLDV